MKEWCQFPDTTLYLTWTINVICKNTQMLLTLESQIVNICKEQNLSTRNSILKMRLLMALLFLSIGYCLMKISGKTMTQHFHLSKIEMFSVIIVISLKTWVSLYLPSVPFLMSWCKLSPNCINLKIFFFLEVLPQNKTLSSTN